jgi:hypothetical protein
MKITYESHKLMSFFVKHNCLNPIEQSNHTDQLLANIFKELLDGVDFINAEKKRAKSISSFYNPRIINIQSISQIPKPTTFSANGFPETIRKTIEEQCFTSISYSFNIYGRKIHIHFVIEEPNVENKIHKYNGYVDYILYWLYIVNKHASPQCSSEVTFFIYHTNMLKTLPDSNIDIISENNVNTGFTRTCIPKSEIVVYRLEEWFKVLIHETMHNFGLDFSDMDNTNCKNRILSIFPVKSEVNLYEAYTEFWARIMNVVFCSYSNARKKDNINELLTNAEFFLNFERIYSFYQMVKVLNFMNIEYRFLISKTGHADSIRRSLYKENSNVLAYYIVTMILINNYEDFLLWCQTNNDTFLQFKKTDINQKHFCRFIEQRYKSPELLHNIECTEDLLTNIKKMAKKNKNKNSKYPGFLLKNLRMTLCELN